MVPLLVYLVGFEQHRAHATSLAAGMFLAAAGGATYAVAGRVDLVAGGLLVVGSLIGAPFGARLMQAMSSERLKIAFGVLSIVMAVVLVLG